ncbi:amidase family protein [Paenibacillus sp. MBLB4367]|uniref:amidase family protein n=1 Tax=Paenibacillus sp. MBLB4367 TaxID=3384767 RepID=UPI003907F9F6
MFTTSWDLEKTCGGSSGGEGALIAVGGAAVGRKRSYKGMATELHVRNERIIGTVLCL